MRAIRFDPEKDLPPIPFSKIICRWALDFKILGLNCIGWYERTRHDFKQKQYE